MADRGPIAPEDCPEPFWHETHRYCPICTWTEPTTAPEIEDAGSATECVNCGIKHDADEDFTYRGYHLCINCMSALISWFLDGGMNDDPEQFDWLLTDEDRARRG